MHKSCLAGVRAILVGSVAVLSISAAAAAQNSADLVLQSQPMADALRHVAQVTHSNIMFTPEAVAGIQAPSVMGRMDAAQAVNELTKGSNLEVVADGWGGLIVRPSAHIMTQAPADPGGGAAGNVEQVTVTGSRVISSITQSPTPLTVVSTEQLQSTTPTDIPDALNKLPVFQGSSQPRTAGNGGTAGGINVLALRNFGAQRTLVLFDSHRVAPANANGTVDVDTLPQQLISRVDVVTGGASAVYGSDAITGVVNFVLDKHFNGLKFDLNTGISNYSDGFSYKLAGAYGTDLFGGRGHFEMSLEHFSQDGVQETDRPYGPQYWSLTGAGTAANPYVQTINARNATASFGGLITCTACTVNGQQFVGNGVLGPFVHGQTTGTGSVESGGDGAYNPYGQVITPFRTNTAFGRFSYNIDDTTTAYVQASGSEAYATGTWYPTNMITGANTASIFYANNPFLPPSIQQALNPANTPNKTFQLTKFIVQFGKQGSPGTRNVNLYRTASAGLDGTLWNRFDWDLYYSHAESRQDVTNYRNPNNQRWYASEDAVVNSAGQVACYVSTTQYASLYPGCVPMNPFGPTAMSKDAYNYISSDTRFIMTNIMDNVSGSVSGTVFDLPAGPVKAALSGEMRWNNYDVNSNASPTAHVDCTGLRLCSSATPLWQQNTVASVTASNNVWEFAGELNVPMLKDLPLIQNLDANLAGRYTDYSTSGTVQTWKIGLDYHVNDDLRFRGTTSIDIRAPTLNDLFAPIQSAVTSFTDLHTNSYGILFITSQGNPNLVPEVARTYTGGAVLTPSWIPGLTFSYDYYHIDLKNAIGSISATNTQIQNLCELSGGTSQYCSLYTRPLPFSDHSPANYPTAIFSKSLNTAYQVIEGSDIEADYHLDFADWGNALPGSMDFRVLANIQPVNELQQFTGAAFTDTVFSKGHVTGFINWNLENWTVGLEDRWISGFTRATQPGIIYSPPAIGSVDFVDLNLQRRFSVDDNNYTAYFTVQNVFNTLAPVVQNQSGSPGLLYPVATGMDVMGRYFTIGLRGSF
jgi:outer membrane receptor protein involved in Fe transport